MNAPSCSSARSCTSPTKDLPDWQETDPGGTNCRAALVYPLDLASTLADYPKRYLEERFNVTGMCVLRIVYSVVGIVFAAMVPLLSAPGIAQENASTLETVKARGHLVCGATDTLPGFSQLSAEGLWSGFDVDICRAIAAAVFNDPGKVEFRPLAGRSRFAQLQNGEIDVIARNGAWDMVRDTNYGAHYAAISFYDGQAFLVPQSLGAVSAYELDEVTVCIVDNGDALHNLRDFFFEIQASYVELTYEDREDLALAYREERCNVISAPASWLYGIKRQIEVPANHRILPELISRLPLGPVVRSGDDEWFNIVRWTLFALINAEELGVTQRNLESLAATRTPSIKRLLGAEGDFGGALNLDPNWMEHVIAAVGNYGEMFDRNFGPQTGAALLRGPNSLWTQGGLLFAPPVR